MIAGRVLENAGPAIVRLRNNSSSNVSPGSTNANYRGREWIELIDEGGNVGTIDD